MGLLCCSLCQMDVDYCIAWATAEIGAHAVELRLDDLIFDTDDIKLFMKHKGDCRVVATYRIKDPTEVDTLDLEPEDLEPEPSEVDMAVRLLSTAIIAGADYIDVDMDFPHSEQRWLMNLAMNYGCKVILSYHNAYGTDSTEALVAIASRCYSLGADIAKIVTTAHHPDECGRVLALYDRFEPAHLIAFAMGQEGEHSRTESFRRGSPLMYCAPRRRLPTADGQPLFTDFISAADRLTIGDIEPPCAKSIAIRAIVAAALTDGVTVLENVTLCDDICDAMEVAKQMCAVVRYNHKTNTLTITGTQDIAGSGLRIRNGILDVGGCGLLCRICIPLAALSHEMVMITGRGSLMRRKFSKGCPELTRRGVFVDFSLGRLPVFVKGPLRAGTFNIVSAASSQFATGLMMALPLVAGGDVVLKVRDTAVLPHIQSTADVISRMGIRYEAVASEEGRSVTYTFSGGQSYKPGRMEIENDWYAASLWLVLGAIAGESGVDNMLVKSLQAETFILDVLDISGADVERYTDPEMEYLTDSIGYHSAMRTVMAAFECDIAPCADLLGPLILLALRCEGESCIHGIKALFGKERLFSEEFSRMGAEIAIEGDTMYVKGGYDFCLQGSRVSSHGDHRLALALLAAQKICRGIVQIDDVDCINRSWPDFPLK